MKIIVSLNENDAQWETKYLRLARTMWDSAKISLTANSSFILSCDNMHCQSPSAQISIYRQSMKYSCS